MDISIEQKLFASYIKYDVLEQLTLAAFKNSNADVVNIYIDMHSILKPLYASGKYMINNIPTSIASSMINLCAHMRAYYRSRHHVETRIYLIYSENRCELNNRIYEGYNNSWRDTLNNNRNITKSINENLELLDILCPYFNDIFFIRTEFEPAVVILDRICKDEGILFGVPNIIISKDPYMYQVVAMKDNTVIFRPKKFEGKDVSFLVTKPYVIYNYMTLFKEKIRNHEDLAYDPGIFSLFLAMTKLPSRNIPALFSSNKAFSILNNLINNNYIINGYNFAPVIQDISLQLNTNLKSRESIKYDIPTRFKAIDIVFQHEIFLTRPEALDERYLIRKIDNDGVREINNKYFRANPLDLMRL